MRLLALLRHRRFDLVFDLQGLSRTGFMTFATRAPFRVGLETAREGANLACNCVLPDSNRNMPAHVRYWRVADALGPYVSGLRSYARETGWEEGNQILYSGGAYWRNLRLARLGALPFFVLAWSLLNLFGWMGRGDRTSV